MNSQNAGNERLVIQNNICNQNAQWQVCRVPTNVAIRYNLIDGFRGWNDSGEVEVVGDNAVTNPPLFMDAMATNFHLQAGSPAIDAGSSSGAPLFDFDGNTRPLDGNGDGQAAVDIGAHEYDSAPNPAPTVLANGTNGTVILGSGETLRVDVALTAGSQAGRQADWWVVAQAPFGWYYYDYINGIGWRQGIGLTFQGPLSDLPDYEILNLSGLLQGTYVIYFGVDTVPDGQISPANLDYSSVTVLVQ